MSGLSFSINVPQPDLGAVASGISNQITDKQQEQTGGSSTNGAVVATIRTFADLDQINAKRGELAALRSDLKTQQTSLSALQTQWAAAEAAHPDFNEKLAAAGGDIAGLPNHYKEAGTLWSQLQAVKTAVDGISAQVSGTEAALVAMGIDVGSPETDVRSASDQAIDQNAQDLATLLKSQATLQTALDGLKAAGSDPQRQAQVESQLNAVKGQINDELQSLGLAPTAAPTTLGGKTLGQIQQEAKQQALTDKSNASPEAQRARTRALNQEAAALKGEMKEIVTKGYTSSAERVRYQMISNELLPAILADIATQPQQAALHASRQQLNELLNKTTDLASASTLLAQREAIDAQLAGLQHPAQASTALQTPSKSKATGTGKPTDTPAPQTTATPRTTRPTGTLGTQATLDSLNLSPPAKPLWMTGSIQDPKSPYGKVVSNWTALKSELAGVEREIAAMAAERTQLQNQIKSFEGSDRQITLEEKADYQIAQSRLKYLNSQDLDTCIKQKKYLINQQIVGIEQALLTATSELTYNNRMKANAATANLLAKKELELLKLAGKETGVAYRIRERQQSEYQLLSEGKYHDDRNQIQEFGSSVPANVNFWIGRTSVEAERKALGLSSGSEVISHWKEVATAAKDILTAQTAVLLADVFLNQAKVDAQTKRVEMNNLAAKGKSTADAEKKPASLEREVAKKQTAYDAALAAYNAKLAEATPPQA